MCVISAGVGVRGPALQPAADSVSEPPGAVQYMYIHVHTCMYIHVHTCGTYEQMFPAPVGGQNILLPS